jgi:hypothetical protein
MCTLTDVVLAPRLSTPSCPWSASPAGAVTQICPCVSKSQHGTTSSTSCSPEWHTISWSSRTEPLCSTSTTTPGAVRILPTALDAPAHFAEVQSTELWDALKQRSRNLLSPYNVNVWERWLSEANLLAVYPDLLLSLCHSFNARIPVISCSYIPPTLSISVDTHPTFANLVDAELRKKHYLGPA